MEKKSPAAKWESWLTRLVRYPGDDGEILLSKKIWLSIVVFTLFLSGTLLAVCASLGMWPLVFITALLFLFLAGALVWFLRVKRHIQQFFLAIETFKIVYSFAAVVVTGGIFQSGGLVFVGLAGIFFALIFPQPEKIWFLLAMYLGSLVLEVALQPWLVPLATFPPIVNLYFFVLTLIISVLTLFFFVRIFMRERMRFRQIETEKLRALDAAKSHFFANISHEFRTPLTVIMGMASEIGEESGRMIRRSGRKLLRLVDQLLDLSRLEAGVLPIHLAQIEMVMEMKYLIDSYHSLAESKDICLYFSSDCEDLWMDTDPEKLEQIVGNLLDNAIKYTPKGGEVRLSLQSLSDRRLLIRIEDTGIGIAPAHREKIFDRFYRAGEWSVEGAGIGLSLAREYVRLLDGEIEVESEEGKGTIFSVYLPFRQSAPRQAVSFAERQDAGTPLSPKKTDDGKPLLLVIEDNPDLSRYLERLLHPDYHVHVASDGEEGVRLALEQVPDVIISDIMMPKKDGFEVCRTVKNDIRTSHIPVILLTARADIASRIGGLEAGADAYLAKPFNHRELEVELARLIRLRETLREKFRQPLAPSPNGKPPGLNERFLQDIHHCLERHYREEAFGIKELCAQLGMSRTQLHRKLAALTGVSASHFIRSFRLKKAKELLQTTRLTVAEAAYAAGFRDAFYFSRVFSQEYGLSPSEARGEPQQ